MGSKFKMKDIANEMFSQGNISLNWLHYMEDGDVLYPGPKVAFLFSEAAISSEYEVLFKTEDFLFIKNLESGKEQLICRTKVRPENYKTNSIKDIREYIQRSLSTQGKYSIENIHGISEFSEDEDGIFFTAETKLYASEHSLVALSESTNFRDEKFRRLLLHAFIAKDIIIPVKARVRVDWNKLDPRVRFLVNTNKHIRVDCYGTMTTDLQAAIRAKDTKRVILLFLIALGNVNLADTLLWGRVELFSSDFTTIIKNGEKTLLTKGNFDSFCPKINVDFNVVKSIVARHEID